MTGSWSTHEGPGGRTYDYVLTYRVSEGDIAHFEMTATAGWVAVGFSSDEFMVSPLRFLQTAALIQHDNESQNEDQ